MVDSKSDVPVNVVFTHVERLSGLGPLHIRWTVWMVPNINVNPPSVVIGLRHWKPKSVQGLCDIARVTCRRSHFYWRHSEDTDYKTRQIRVKKTLYSLMKVINPASQAQRRGAR